MSTSPKAPKTFSVDGLGGAMAMDAASISSGMAFLNAELEKRDPRLLEPLQSVTWMRDIVSRTGGGWVEFSSNYFVDYATTGSNENGIIGGETNTSLQPLAWCCTTYLHVAPLPENHPSK